MSFWEGKKKDIAREEQAHLVSLGVPFSSSRKFLVASSVSLTGVVGKKIQQKTLSWHSQPIRRLSHDPEDPEEALPCRDSKAGGRRLVVGLWRAGLFVRQGQRPSAPRDAPRRRGAVGRVGPVATQRPPGLLSARRDSLFAIRSRPPPPSGGTPATTSMMAPPARLAAAGHHAGV